MLQCGSQTRVEELIIEKLNIEGKRAEKFSIEKTVTTEEPKFKVIIPTIEEYIGENFYVEAEQTEKPNFKTTR